MLEALRSLLAATAVIAAAPIAVALLPGRVPQVVALILGGIAIGPMALGLGDPEHVELFAHLGLGFLFLLAGYELEPSLLRERAGRLAMASWVISAVMSIAIVGVLARAGFVRAFMPVAIGLTTTALGTLLPVLREHHMHRGAFGRYVFAAGAIGEIGPVLAIAILLGRHGSLLELLGVSAVAAVAFLLSVVPRLIRGTPLDRVIAEKAHDTSQTTLRLTLLLLVLLLLLSAEFGLDIVLGAFFAGMVLRRSATDDVASLEHKLDAVGYGFFIPVFFVSSGMGLDVRTIVERPLRLLVFFALLLLVRGVPSLVLYRRELPAVRRVQLALLTATALPLLVALAEVGLDSGMMLPENAAALVGAGVLSVALFPLLAVRLEPRARARDAGAVARD
jgi:Kef-type K+ transport system membrane component KefB